MIYRTYDEGPVYPTLEETYEVGVVYLIIEGTYEEGPVHLTTEGARSAAPGGVAGAIGRMLGTEPLCESLMRCRWGP